MNTEDHRMPQRRTDVEIHQFTDEYVLHDELNGLIHVLNPTAYVVWSSCDGTITFEELLEKVSLEFTDTDGTDLATDIGQIIDQLREKKLLSDSNS